MTKLEERLTQLADQSVERYNDNDTHIQYKMRKAGKLSFIQGARAVLEMPELKALVKSLEFAASEDMWESNQNFDEWFKYKYTKWYQDEIKESLEQWRSFTGEGDNEANS